MDLLNRQFLDCKIFPVLGQFQIPLWSARGYNQLAPARRVLMALLGSPGITSRMVKKLKLAR
jgi:hypothetical protein